MNLLLAFFFVSFFIWRFSSVEVMLQQTVRNKIRISADRRGEVRIILES